ncbi:MAG TPA: Gfo/Idh/MocA family oxidoreductase [Candidatus Latescibacteria bacterium]|nr:Gfo/Idh/MocA family oxidoreductase [Candidatus Latescibacterota bacterium]
MIRMALIGCGSVSRDHLTSLRTLRDRFRLEWAVDVNEEAARRVADEWGCRWATDYRRALDDPEVDAVDIATPHHLHAEMAVTSAEAGKHIFLEKPMATTLEDADRIIGAAERAGVVLMVGYVFRYRPAFRMLHDIVEEGRYGRPFLAHGLMEVYGPHFLAPWMKRKDQLGGGALFSAGGHLLDLMIWNFGEVKRAFSLGENKMLNMEGEDTAVAGFLFEGGGLGNIIETWAVKHNRYVGLLEVYCEEAVLRASLGGWPPDVRTRLVVYGEKEEVLIDRPGGWEFDGEFLHFAECIEEGKVPLTDGREARKSLEGILMAYRTEELIR